MERQTQTDGGGHNINEQQDRDEWTTREDGSRNSAGRVHDATARRTTTGRVDDATTRRTDKKRANDAAANVT